MQDDRQPEDTEFADEAETLQPEPPRAGIERPADPPPGQQLATPIVMERQPLTEAAKSVPVTSRGAAPTTFEQQVTLAQFMAKGSISVPDFLRGNAGDCLAIIDIASRTGLSPYMLANVAYKTPNGRMAFESKAYHAILIQSGQIKDAALHIEYKGEGGDRTCTVWATLMGENKPRRYTSPPLKDLHPGYSFKTEENGVKSTKSLSYMEGQKIKADAGGNYVAGLFCRGSPLWDRKPDIQFFYDTSRDFGRVFTPAATLGILEQYESIDRSVEMLPPTDNGLKDRLTKADRSEGFQNGHADRELANVAADKGEIQPAQTIQAAGDQQQAKAQGATPPKPEVKKPDPPRATSLERGRKPTAKQTQAAADRAEKKRPEHKPEQKKPEPPKQPTNTAEYQVYCMDWINRTGDPEHAVKRWEEERALRKECGVRTAMANDLRFRIETKHGI